MVEMCVICEAHLDNEEIAYSTGDSAPLCYRCFYFFGNLPLPFYCCVDCADPEPVISLCRQLLKLKLLQNADNDDYARHRPAYYEYLRAFPEYLNKEVEKNEKSRKYDQM